MPVIWPWSPNWPVGVASLTVVPSSPSSNGRVTPRRSVSADDGAFATRQRSPLVRWVALLLVVALAAGVLASLVAAILA